MPKIKLECCHADTCLPDYWSGHHLPHIQIPVWNGMSLKDIKSSVMQELRYGAVMGSGETARLLSADLVRPGEDQLADKITKAAYAAVNRMKPSKKGQRKFFTNLDKVVEDDCCETVYAYFVFIEL